MSERAIKEPWRCKAMATATNRRCRRHADDSGYCAAHQKLHKPNRLLAVKHGIYATYYTAEELRVAAGIKPDDDLAQEIVSARLVVRRALAAWDTYRQKTDSDPELDLVEARRSRRAGPDGRPVDEYTMRRERPDLWAIYDRAVGRVGHLLEQQHRIHEVQGLEQRMEQILSRLDAQGNPAPEPGAAEPAAEGAAAPAPGDGDGTDHPPG